MSQKPPSATTYDPLVLRADVPSVQSGIAHFDGPGGTQTPRTVANAIAAALCGPLSNRGVNSAAQLRANEIVLNARQAIADLLGGDPRGVIFGRSMTQITFDMARTLSSQWSPGDEIIVSRLDHDANIRPWMTAADRVGARVVWLDFDPATAQVSIDAVATALSPRTKLLTITGASNLVGTRPDIAAITALARTAGVLTYIDAVHLAAHARISYTTLGADFIACSPYKFLGPHMGALIAAPSLLESLSPDKLAPSTMDVPERFELGTLPYELLAGVTAAVDVLAELVPDQNLDTPRAERLDVSLAALGAYEDQLSSHLAAGLAAMPRVHSYSNAAHKTPTHLFSVAGFTGASVSAFLQERGVEAPSGSFYALECSRHLGLGDAGAIRAGLAPYSTLDDVDRLLAAVAELPAA